MALRLRTKPEGAARLIVAGLIALALLALGEQAPAALPVHVSIEAHAASLEISVDGQTHEISSALGGGWQRVMFDQPGPLQREYQVDGSDTTATNDRKVAVIQGLLDTPLYRFDAFLRDESSYSRWENLRITDLSTGAAGADPQALPDEFRLDVDLRRPEALARVWLAVGPDQREGLEIDRDTRNARWVMQRGQTTDTLPRWFFPEQPAPFVAELLHLLGRSAMAAFALALAAWGLGRVASRWRTRGCAREDELPECDAQEQPEHGDDDWWRYGVVGLGAIGMWLVAAGVVSVRAYHQLPHILDAVSYVFQAGLFATGQLSLPAPPQPEAFKGPFEVLWQQRLFSQYPPGAPALYAIGKALSVEWLVGPLACAVLIGATAWVAYTLFGPRCGLATLALGVISPFVLFQSGSYLSHPIAGGLLAGALAAFVAGETTGRQRWYAVCGVLLGAAFVAREAASVLFAVPLGVRLLVKRQWNPLGYVVAFGTPFLMAYLLYNMRQTGSPLLLPRTIFDPSDHFGFGNGIGFHTRHTLAAGLANTDELLTLLQFDLFGWPPLFALGLVGMPFLVRRPHAWDWVAAGGFLTFVAAYVGYFYHGVALGPRYYFEAVPYLLLLGGRGVQTLAFVARGWVVPLALVGLLGVYSVLFYLPTELERRLDTSGLPGALPLTLDFVRTTALGPQLVGVPPNTVVVTSDWWIYNAALAALNCPHVPACDVVFALAPTDQDVLRLRAQFPDRQLLRAVDNDGHESLVPL